MAKDWTPLEFGDDLVVWEINGKNAIPMTDAERDEELKKSKLEAFNRRETMLYKRLLSDQEQAIVHAYLAKKHPEV